MQTIPLNIVTELERTPLGGPVAKLVRVTLWLGVHVPPGLPAASWLNWIEEPPPKGQGAGSNPAEVAISNRKLLQHFCLRRMECDQRNRNNPLVTRLFTEVSVSVKAGLTFLQPHLS